MLLEIFKRFKLSHPKPSEPHSSETNHQRQKSNHRDLAQSLEDGPITIIPSQKPIRSSHGHPDHDPAIDLSHQKFKEHRHDRVSSIPETDLGQLPQRPDTGNPLPQSSNEAVSFFREARGFTADHLNVVGISGSHNVVKYFDDRKTALEQLLPYICTGAAVDSSERDPPPSCHPGTREEIQRELATWFDNAQRQWNMIWLTGPAGTGKSAVAQTFAEFCVAKGRLGAAFFFSRPNKRDKPSTVIPTLAYQLAIHFPEYRLLLTDRIAHDLTILQKTPRAQFMRLIVEPFSTLQVRGHSVTRDPLLVLLDGLDECQGIHAQREFVEMIAEVARLKKGLPLLWLICSRPEPHLKHIFSRPDYSIDCSREELFIDAKTRNDVDLYLLHSFARLRAEFRDVVDPFWPSRNQFNEVSKITSGLFVLASTIMKYLGDIVYTDPMARLVYLLEFMRGAHRVGMKNPLEALDLFYSNVLTDVPEDVFLTTKRILSHHLALQSSYHGSFSVQTLCNFLNINRTAFYAALRKLHSVVDVSPPEDACEGHLRFYHASFEDYLSSPIRSGKFAIDLDGARAEMSNLCPFSFNFDREDIEPSEDPNLMPSDIIDLLRTHVLHSEHCDKTLLETNGVKAQRILDILHKALGTHLVDDAARRSILIAFWQLSESSGLFPQQMGARGVKGLSQPVRTGTYTRIHKSEYQGHLVCVKIPKLRPKEDPKILRNVIVHEAFICSQLAHPNVLPFYGVYHPLNPQGQKGLVSPWLKNGNLSTYLLAYPSTPRLQLVHNILAGLRYLHHHEIVHGDIKGENILIKDNGSPCLTDFALSSINDPDMAILKTPAGNVISTSFRWCAPELIVDDPPSGLTFSNDVYSAASTMFETFSGKIPYYEISGDISLVRQKRQGRTPTRPNHEIAPELTDSIWAIMEQCWSMDPHNRPIIDGVINRLPTPPLLQHQSVQEDFWRPEIVWTAAEINADKRFLMDFFNL